jgi:hypothetical protein
MLALLVLFVLNCERMLKVRDSEISSWVAVKPLASVISST